jgi:Ser/Thr protein kinase RdoA (MazF antagonist)
MVMTWLPGVLLQGDRLTEANLSRMGELFARLHAHAATFEPPEGFTRRRMDTLYARGEEDALFGAACADAFTPRTRDLLERTRARVDDAFRRLYADPAGLRVIHNDLHHGNIKLYRGRLFPFDFEDTVWGYLVQDLAMALQDLMLDVAPAAFEPLQTALRRGYERYSPWPETEEGQIDTLRAGRLLWVANYVARYEGEHLQGFLHRLAGMLERYLDTGRVRKADT